MSIPKFVKRAVLAASLVAAAAASAQDIKLGYNGDLSASPSAQSGQAAVLGMQAAIDDVNAAGGVLGKKLTLVVRDDTSQPPKSIQNMSDLIDNEKVVAVFGPTNSGNAMAWKHIPNQKKIPVIGNVGSGTDITKPLSAGADNYMFRVSMVDRDTAVGGRYELDDLTCVQGAVYGVEGAGLRRPMIDDRVGHLAQRTANGMDAREVSGRCTRILLGL